MMDRSAEYGSCQATGSKEAQATYSEYEGLSDSQSVPTLQSDYKEVCMPPREAKVPSIIIEGKPDVAYVSSWQDVDSGCRIGMALLLSAVSMAGCFVVVILIATGTPEPGWMEAIVALLFGITTLWLYTLVNQAVAIRDFKAQNLELRRQVYELSDVEKKLESVAESFEGDKEKAAAFVSDLGSTMTSRMIISLMNKIWATYNRLPQLISVDESEHFLEHVLDHLWAEKSNYEENRQKIKEWLKGDEAGGRPIREIYDLVRRVAIDEHQLQYPDASQVPIGERVALLAPPSEIDQESSLGEGFAALV